MTARRTRLLLALALFAGCAAAVSAAEVVILKDGFVIQGNVRKESTFVFDKPSGTSVAVVKANGLDIIDEGPKITIFSTHTKQLGAISPDIKLRPDYKAYTTAFLGRKSLYPLAGVGESVSVGEFNSRWVRVVEVKAAGSANQKIDQQITHLDPYFIYIVSATHSWRLTFRTSEWDPPTVRKLLVMHPELNEPDGKCNPLRRIAIAKFMLDAGWLQAAKDELERLKRDHAAEFPKEAKDAHEKILKEIDQATAELVVKEAEIALGAGRYIYAADLLAIFPEKNAEPKEVARAAKVGADLKTAQERHDTARRHLARLTDVVSGRDTLNPLIAVGSGLAVATWKPAKALTPQALELIAAANQVAAELHPDSAIRIELFVTLVTQQGPKPPAEQLLAAAISGWAQGKNAATPKVEDALKIWTARNLILEYQRGADVAARGVALAQLKKTAALEIPQLAQIISLLPPAEPEDMNNRTGKAVALGKNVPGGVYRRKTTPVPGHVGGVEYLVKLPPEYHHGRAYPVLIVLTHAGNEAEAMVGQLMTESEKNGYIVIAPEWTSQFGKGGWQWKGEDHIYVTAALRDAVRHFTVDNDRVFLCGAADGANMAMDVAVSHPDLFAGVVPMSPYPRWGGHFVEAWRNAQKLPFYVVTGELAGDSVPTLKKIFEQWTPKGFPAVMAVYKGRGIEWYGAETPTIFEWMSRKTRANGVATLALGTNARQPWIMLRETDNRFYWLQADKVVVGKNSGAVVPATMLGDLRGNQIVLETKGVKHLTIWLSSDMIDWASDVKVQLNSGVPRDWPRAKKVVPSLDVLLEDYHDRGDRRMLFLNKIELGNIP